MWPDEAIIHSPSHFLSYFLSRQPSRFPAAPPADQHTSWSSGGRGSPPPAARPNLPSPAFLLV